jgi:hypothetical protein
MARLFDDASSEYLTIPLAAALAPPFTVACWGHNDASVGAAATSISICNSAVADDDYWALYVRSDEGVIWRAFDDGGEAQTLSGSITLNTWHHHVGVEASSSSRFHYLDGVASVEQGTAKTPDGVDRIGIGAFVDSTPSFYHTGRLFWPAIWNVALTAAEIGHLAAGYSPLTVRRQNLVMFARLHGDEDIDMIGNQTITAVNTPSTGLDADGVRRVQPRGRGRGRIRQYV